MRRQLPATTLVDGVYQSALGNVLGFDLFYVELESLVEGRCTLELFLEAVKLMLDGDLMLQLRFAEPSGMAVESGDVVVQPGNVAIVDGTDLEVGGMLAIVYQQGWKPSTSDNRLSNCISRGRPREASVENPTQFGRGGQWVRKRREKGARTSEKGIDVMLGEHVAARDKGGSSVAGSAIEQKCVVECVDRGGGLVVVVVVGWSGCRRVTLPAEPHQPWPRTHQE